MTPAVAGLLGGLALVWGTSFLLIKIADSAMSPGWIVLGRMALGALVAGLVARARHDPQVQGLHRWGHVALLALFASVLPFGLLAWGERHVPSGLAGVLNATTPLFTVAIAAVALPSERIGGAKMAWMAVSFGGVVLVLAPTVGGAGELVGELACMAAAASYGIGFVHTRRVVGRWGLSPPAVSAAQLGSGALMAAAMLPLWGTDITLRPLPLLALGVLGTVNTGAAYLAYHSLVRRAGATRSSTVTYLAPIVAVAVGIAIRGESFAPISILGAFVLLVGLAGAEGRLGRLTASWRGSPKTAQADAAGSQPGRRPS